MKNLSTLENLKFLDIEFDGLNGTNNIIEGFGKEIS